MPRLLPIVIVLAIGGVGAAIYCCAVGPSRTSQPARSPDVDALAEAPGKPPPSLAQTARPTGRQVALPAAAERDGFVRDRVLAALDAHADLATLSSVDCEGQHCRVVLEVPDMTAFGPAYERLQDTTFVGLAKSILLANPEPIGAAGAHRVTFTVEFASE